MCLRVCVFVCAHVTVGVWECGSVCLHECVVFGKLHGRFCFQLIFMFCGCNVSVFNGCLD